MKKLIKNVVRTVLNYSVIPMSRYVIRRVPSTTVLRELERRAAVEGADYAESHMQASLQFEKKGDLWDHALSKRAADGLVAEFGVWTGTSTNHIARRASPGIVYGFDSFEGLKEDWRGWELRKGNFDRGGVPPRVEPNVRLVKGWFDQTLPKFLAENREDFSFVHVDCDTYEASRTVLGLLGGRLKAGAVIVFDEYLGYRGWKIGEFKAWQEFVRERGISYAYLGFSNQAVSVQIVDAPRGARGA